MVNGKIKLAFDMVVLTAFFCTAAVLAYVADFVGRFIKLDD